VVSKDQAACSLEFAMDDLTARLEALLRLYAAAGDRGEGSARLTGQFQEDLQLLVAKYGPPMTWTRRSGARTGGPALFPPYINSNFVGPGSLTGGCYGCVE
jgi:hypothetical protein